MRYRSGRVCGQICRAVGRRLTTALLGFSLDKRRRTYKIRAFPQLLQAVFPAVPSVHAKGAGQRGDGHKRDQATDKGLGGSCGPTTQATPQRVEPTSRHAAVWLGRGTLVAGMLLPCDVERGECVVWRRQGDGEVGCAVARYRNMPFKGPGWQAVHGTSIYLP